MVAEKTLEKLDGVAANSLGWLEEFSKKGIEFIEREAPQLCNEVVNLGIAKAIMLIIVGLLMAVTVGFVLAKIGLYVKKNNSKMDYGDWGITSMTSLALFIPFGFGIVNIYCGIYDIVVINVAPRIYLINYFVNLIDKIKG